MVRIYTHFILFKIKSIFTVFNGLKFMVAVKVRPAPQATVNDMRQSFTMGHLEAAIKRPRERGEKNIPECSELLTCSIFQMTYSELWRLEHPSVLPEKEKCKRAATDIFQYLSTL